MKNPSHRPAVFGSFSLALALGALATGCSSPPESKFATNSTGTVQAKRLPDGSIDDQSKCEWRGRQDRETTETAGPGAIMPNVRRVYAIVGTGVDRQRVLVCREIDTNLDGVKDVVRKYNDKGESLFEEADANYDGRVDTWLTFSKGHLAEAKLDTDFDGNPDEWDYYSGGKISRIKRDTNHDGKPDRWEIYGSDGKLERMGVDVDNDERVDRWDVDTDVRRAKDEADRKQEDAAAEKAAKEQQQGEYSTNEGDADKTEGDDKKAGPTKGKKPAAKGGDKPKADKPPKTDAKAAPKK
jgi:hypothetical protein